MWPCTSSATFRVLGERAPDWEIEEARFFPRSALPEGTTAGARARLAEIFEFGAPFRPLVIDPPPGRGPNLTLLL